MRILARLPRLIMLIAIVIIGAGCADMGALSNLVNLSTGTNKSDGGQTVLSQNNTAKGNIQKTLLVQSIDVDIAASRVKRYYKFSSNEELQQLRNGTDNQRWQAAAVAQDFAWDAQPSTYYKMGKHWGGENDSILIELERKGKGSQLFITFRSDQPSHLTDAYTANLFEQIKQVAEGKVR